jgi:hypothetical protein
MLHGAFAARVGRVGRRGHGNLRGDDVNDAPVVRHLGICLAHQEERDLCVDRERAVVLFLGRLGEQLADDDAGGVDENVPVPEVLDRRIDESGDLGELGEIGLVGHGLDASGLQIRHDLGRFIVAAGPVVVHDDIRSIAGQGFGEQLAEVR